MPQLKSQFTYLKAAAGGVFAIFQPADPEVERASPVLICPPWGWAEVASYRSRREWASRLAAAGHPTLRFALPATGNSAGSPHDGALVAAWIEAVVTASRWLRGAAGTPGVAALGLGLGGLLARAAIEVGAPIDELILWAAPVSGKAFVRETRAFSRMQSWNAEAVEGTPPGAGLPQGWIEAGGFVLSAETLAELKGLDPAAASPPRRALLLDRDGVAVDEGLRERLETAGAAVSVAPGQGWAALVSHAERTKLPVATADRVAAWLREGGTAAAPGPGESVDAAAAGELAIEVDGVAVRERPLAIEHGFGRAFGILAEPAVEPVGETFAVFLNAGAVRNVGPNRLWVEAAREWAARGVRTLRLDLEGIGEAEGEAPPRVCDFYLPKYQRQLAAVLDRLQALGNGERFVLVGLCAGGYWAFREAVEDQRVASVVLINSGALAWDNDLVAQREARKLGRASQRHWWGRLLRGNVGARRIGSLLWASVSSAARALRRLARRRRVSLREEIEADLGRLEESGTRLTLAFSAGEALAQELDDYGIAGEVERWPRVGLVKLPADDHTLRPVVAQAAARELLERELEQLLR